MAYDLLITGAGGQLGSVLLRAAMRRGVAALGVVSPSGPRPRVGDAAACDLRDADATAQLMRTTRPRAVVHAAAMTSVADCFSDPAGAAETNVAATVRLATLGAEQRTRIMVTSTDLVFDGRTGGYDESSVVEPLSVYGRTKVAGEAVVLGAGGCVARLPLMYGLPAAERRTTFAEQLQTLRAGRALKLFHDEFRSPLWLEDAADALLRLVEAEHVGLVHVGGPERLSRLELGRLAAAAIGADGGVIQAVSAASLASAEPRPADVSLRSERFASLFGRPAGRPAVEALRGVAAEFGSGVAGSR